MLLLQPIRRTTACLCFTLRLKLAIVFWAALGSCLSAYPAGLGYDEFLWDVFSAVWTFHRWEDTTRLVVCLQAATV